MAQSKILVIDDYKTNIRIMTKMLENDYNVSTACSGEEALEIVANDTFDLILLDVMMPGMNGYEVCKRLKSVERTQNIPVIFVTSMDDVENEAYGFEIGAVDYITKPISKAILRARVKTHLNLKHAYEKLEQRKKELEETAVLRENVERIMQHDLKNPLNVIIGIPKLMLASKDISEKQQLMLNKIRNSGQRMLELINRSLDMYKMEINTYQYKPVEVNLITILNDIIIGNKKMSVGSKNIQIFLNGSMIQHDSNESLEFIVQGEEMLFFSLLSNLIKNALEATPDSGVVSIQLDDKTEGKSIAIHNQIPVPEAIRERFFDKYVTEGKKDGTGLGTYSAKLITKTMNGEIKLDTSETDGTTIEIVMPHKQVDMTLDAAV